MGKIIKNAKLRYGTKRDLILESICEIVWEADLAARSIKIIGGFNDFFCLDNTKIITFSDFTDKIIILEDKDEVKHEFYEYINGNSIFLNIQCRIKTKNSEIKWILIKGKTEETDNKIKKLILGTFTDITDRKKDEEKILYMTSHDQLTGLPNNTYFMKQMQGLISMETASSKKGAVLFVDIDNFNSVNDSFGHRYGDILLRIISELIKSCVKDYGMTARMGGDEFLILVPDIISTFNLKSMIKQIMRSFQNPFEVLDIQTYVTVSIGISIFHIKDANISKVLKNADLAVYQAKQRGKNSFIFYNEKLKCSFNRKKIIENNLQKALENNEFEIYYQPQVDINYDKIMGLEALLRWKSPELGYISPDEFIPIAEESELIYKIGEWVLRKSCIQAGEWKAKGYSFDTISVNISPKQLKNKYFIRLINDVLEESALNAEYLEIEITEGTLIKSIEEKSKLLDTLINKKINLSIDDFGKGYSSLNYLTSLPISTLKIDKSFIDKICKDNKSLSIVECIIELSKKLHYKVIAEGVESSEQRDLLRKIGCTYIQGYYYSKPLPASMIEDIFKGKETSYA